MTNLKNLGNKIRELRKEKGLTQEKLAELADIDPKSIIEIEGGKRNTTFNSLSKIANALNVSVEDFLAN